MINFRKISTRSVPVYYTLTLSLLFPKPFHCLIVRIQAPDVKAPCRHGPGMHRRMLHHIMRQVTWCILATTVLHSVSDKLQVFLLIEIKKRPSGSWALAASPPY